MVGCMMWRTENEHPNQEQFKKAPFYEILSSWKSSYKSNCTKDNNNGDDSTHKDSENLVTVGLFEGENLLFPLIASENFAALKWLLKEEKKSSGETRR